MRRSLPILALFAVSAPSFSQNNQATHGISRDLETVVVTATRTEKDIANVPATVTLKTAEEIEQEVGRDIRDLIRYEPGVSIGGTAGRFGLGGFAIRGIGGNRVLTLLDGVRVADAFSFGPFLSANRDYVDVDSLKAFEIVRGPGSALYGSDALGGVVAFRTKDARDYLDGAPFYAGIKAGYSGVDDSTVGTVALATGADTVSGMLLYTRRNAHETENYGGMDGTGPGRELPDPQDIESDNALLKLSVHPSERHRFTFAADLFHGATESRVLSDYGTITSGVRTSSYDADDTIERRRYSIDYTYSDDGGVFDRISAQLYDQSSEQVQRTRQERLSLADATLTHRWRDSFFDQSIEGLSIQADSLLERSGSTHYFVVGAEYWSTDSASLRDGATVAAATGAVIPEFTALPTRDFPPTTIDQYGIYVQDEIALFDNRLLLTPSVRFDSFDANAVADPIFLAGNPGQPAPEDFDDSEVSPKLGLIYRLSGRLSLYAQYAEGFKAPPYSDVNVGFTNPIGGYKTISNPDLESERSRSAELGLRVTGDLSRISLVVFKNEYDNFIESFLTAPQFASTGGVDPADGLLTFQSRNLEGVAIDGLEVKGEVELGAARDFALHFAVAYADGEDSASGSPVDSIDPAKAVLGLRYAAPSGRWGGDAVWTLVDGKDAGDVSSARYLTGSYGLLDLLGHYYFADRVRLNFGFFNVGDKRYIEWADTAPIAMQSGSGTFPEAARYTRPGFNAGMTLRVDF
jgi:hemoglobin/transferrin/lactoferrin receptor protein